MTTISVTPAWGDRHFTVEAEEVILDDRGGEFQIRSQWIVTVKDGELIWESDDPALTKMQQDVRASLEPELDVLEEPVWKRLITDKRQKWYRLTLENRRGFAVVVHNDGSECEVSLEDVHDPNGDVMIHVYGLGRTEGKLDATRDAVAIAEDVWGYFHG